MVTVDIGFFCLFESLELQSKCQPARPLPSQLAVGKRRRSVLQAQLGVVLLRYIGLDEFWFPTRPRSAPTQTKHLGREPDLRVVNKHVASFTRLEIEVVVAISG